MARIWRPVLLVGLLATGAYFLIANDVIQSFAFDAFAVASIALIVLGAVAHRPEHRSIWYLLAAGQGLMVAGDIVWGIYDIQGLDPFPSKADAFYLLGYPLLASALYLLVRRRAPGQDRRGLVDALVITLGIGLLAWVYLIKPYVTDPELTVLEVAISMAYPLMDVLLLALVARLFVSPGARVPSFYLLAGSLLTLLLADVLFGYGEIAGLEFATGSIPDLGYLLAYLLVAVAALHPSMRRLTEHQAVRTEKLTAVRLTLLGLASLAAPAMLAIQTLRREPIDVWVVVFGSAVMFLLVIGRMAGLIREASSAAEELEFQSVTLKSTLTELRSIEAQRRRLLDRSMSASDEERRRLAAELHDGPIQRLATLQYGLERATRQLELGRHETAFALLEGLSLQLAGETNSLRRLMAELRPPALDESGLVGAIRDHIVGFERHSKVAAVLDADVAERLDPELETVLYRVVQEALTNVAKHARAQHVLVTVRSNAGTVELQIADDGVGFDREAASAQARNGHLGLIAMRERVEMAGGVWRVESAPNEGTRVRVLFEKAKVT
jgi:signal transduction histidine kinase